MYLLFFQAEDGIRDGHVTGVQTCALPISRSGSPGPPSTPRRRSTARRDGTGRPDAADRGARSRGHTSVMARAPGGRPQEPWTLYPDEYGIFDRRGHSQSFYHAHAGAEHEARHFHTVRLFRDRTVHLVAISMAHTG